MGTQVINCPSCGSLSHTGNHDDGYEETGVEFVKNETVFGSFYTLYGCMNCGHVWVGY